MAHYVYLAECSDGTFYCGYTTNLKRRVEEHNVANGEGAKYTRSRRPVKLTYQEKFATRGQALRREHELKQLTHAQKRELVG